MSDETSGPGLSGRNIIADRAGLGLSPDPVAVPDWRDRPLVEMTVEQADTIFQELIVLVLHDGKEH